MNAYDTEAFGRFETRLESVADLYAFTGREFDFESGFYFYKARYYDPLTGRFISEDRRSFQPGDLNLYRYVSNTPESGDRIRGQSIVFIPLPPFLAVQVGEDGWRGRAFLRVLAASRWCRGDGRCGRGSSSGLIEDR